MSGVRNARSSGEGALLFALGMVLTGICLWATATGGEDGWFIARDLLKISLPTCDLGLLLATGVLE